MNRGARSSTTKKDLRHLGYLSGPQDTALRRVAEKVSRERGTDVTRSDVTREALSKYCRENGVEWPA